MKRLTILYALAAVAVSALIFSCDSEKKKTYDVTVAWEIGGIQSCESSPLPADLGGVPLVFDDIEITVWDDEKDLENENKEPVMEGLTTDCSDLEYTIEDIGRGGFFVEVEAIATHDGMTLPYFKGSGEITVPNDETTMIMLRMNTGAVTVGWDFDQGFCSGNDVEEVQVTLKDGSKTETSGKIPCTDEKYRFEDLDWGLYTLEIEGFNADGEMTHQGSYMAEEGEDTGEADPDAGVDTKVGADDPNLLDIRPGSGSDEDETIWVILHEV